MKRRDALKALGFSGAVLGSGGAIALLSGEDGEDCFSDLSRDEFYDRIGSVEGEELYDQSYDINDNGEVDRADLEVFNEYKSTDYDPEKAMYCRMRGE